MVQQIVARRDGGKHLAHRPRGRLLVSRSFRRRANNCGFDRFAQWFTLLRQSLLRQSPQLVHRF